MTDKEFEIGVEDLARMLKNIRRIRDKGQKSKLKREVRSLMNELLKD